MSAGRLAPARARLVLHSLRLGLRWCRGGLRRGRWPHARAGLYRIVVPLEPWRLYELARVAAEPIGGDCLDVSSPKLLASTLAAARRGRWTAIDLLPEEIATWRDLDPALDLRVADARALPFPDGSFDTVVCVSVIEHIAGDGDRTAMAELRRVLRPGGVLHLTTNVAARPGEVRTAAPVYAPTEPGGPDGEPGPSAPATDLERPGFFFERRYSPATLRERLLEGWTEEAREYVRERRPIHAWFFGARPFSFLLGWALPLLAAGNFRRIPGPEVLAQGEWAVAYLRLRRPA